MVLMYNILLLYLQWLQIISNCHKTYLALCFHSKKIIDLTLTKKAVESEQVKRIFGESSITTLPFSLNSSKLCPKKINGKANTMELSNRFTWVVFIFMWYTRNRLSNCTSSKFMDRKCKDTCPSSGVKIFCTTFPVFFFLFTFL